MDRDREHASGDSDRRSSRRRFLQGAAGAAAAGLGAAIVSEDVAAAAPSPTATVAADAPPAPVFPGERVSPSDRRYATLSMGFNQRWTSTPAYIQVVGDTRQVVNAVQDALQANRRITVRSGGHCYEDFVSNNPGGVIIDMSQMNGISQDRDGTVWLEAGCTNWDVYNDLYRRYGVTIPGGSCYSVGIGGLVCGGGFGLLSRTFGLPIDYLKAVEVVVVDQKRRVRVVTASRDDRDPATVDLWWAHTGGGGGNFGIITRYGFTKLPQPPPQVLLTSVSWPWSTMTATKFKQLVQNFGNFFAANSAPSSPYNKLFSILHLNHVSGAEIQITTQVAGTDNALWTSYLEAIQTGVGDPVPQQFPVGERQILLPPMSQLPWLQATQSINGSGPNRRGKYKSAYMKVPFPDNQITAMYNALTDASPDAPKLPKGSQALVQFDSYGCQVNTVDPAATAVAQRSSIMKLQYQVYWTDPNQDGGNLAWIRNFYESVYFDTGGVPSPNAVTDGCYVNYCDADLPAPGAPGVDWPTLYYKDNYPRLQRVKARWDPNNIFNHAQSIRLP
jgi:hypothetical protein